MSACSSSEDRLLAPAPLILGTALAPTGTPARLARAARFHPEWAALVLLGVSWVAFVGHAWVPGHEGTASSHLGAGVSAAALASWGLMSVAMMTPGCLPATRHLALNSLHRRRRRAMTLFLSSYFVLWMVFGALVLTALAAVRGHVGVVGGAADPLLPAALLVAAAWQLSARKQQLLRACDRTVPLPPRGWRAEAGSARFGLAQGWACMGSCWALMVVMAVAGHASLVWMVALSALVGAERLTRVGRRLARPSAVALAAAALLVVGVP